MTISGGWAYTSESTNGGGGGISNLCTLTLNNCIISGNTSNGAGGIFSDGTLTLNNSTVSGNTSTSGAGGALGNVLSSLTLNNSTVSGNVGAGIFSWWGTERLTNSTVSDNTGSGIYHYGDYGTAQLTLTDSTVRGTAVRTMAAASQPYVLRRGWRTLSFRAIPLRTHRKSTTSRADTAAG